MAFTSISSTAVQAGKAITQSLMDLIRTNLDDLDSRLTSVEGVASKIVIFDELIVNATSFSTLSGYAVYRTPAAFTLTDAKLYIFTKGSLTGTLQADIKVSSTSDFSGASSVFTTKPSIAYATASNYEESSNAVFDGTAKVLSAGDYLRFDITSMPSGGTLGKFGFFLIGEPS